jgi:Uma2 family endonuclease
MNAIASPIGHSSVLPPLPLYHFSVDQYHRLVDVGVLGDEEPVELLEGLIVLKGNAKLVPEITALPRPGTRGRYPPLPVRRFTLQEYHRMIERGIFTSEDRVELLEGWVVCKMTRNPPHDVALALVLKALGGKVPKGWHCRSQSAITTDVSEPEPDVAVVRGVERDYSAAHPRPRDVGLIVEVADRSVQTDRDLKGPLYGRVGIPVYWLLNLPDGRLELYSDPTGPDPNPCYRQRQDLTPADSAPLVLDGREVCRIPVLDLLP